MYLFATKSKHASNLQFVDTFNSKGFILKAPNCCRKKIAFPFSRKSSLVKSELKTSWNIGLQFLASGPSISHEIRRISCKIHPKPYKSKCFNQNYSVWWMQEKGYDPRFHDIQGHSPLPAPPKLKSFCWNIWFYKVLGGFHMKSAGFQNMSFCVMTKYRSFFRKTNKITL